MKVIYLILLIHFVFNVFCFGQQADTIVFIEPEVSPSFQYDTCTSMRTSLMKCFEDNYRMPATLLDYDYEGRIYIEFVVEKDGTLSNIKVVRGIYEPLDKSVAEYVKAMPKWIPGKNNRKIVRTKFIIPVSIQWLY